MTKVTTSLNTEALIELPGGLQMYVGTGVFSTTDASVAVNHPFDTIVGGGICAVSAAAIVGTTDLLELRTGTSAGQVAQNSDGSLTGVSRKRADVYRETGDVGVSGLAFSVMLIGR